MGGKYSFLVAIPTIQASTIVQGARAVEPGALEAVGYVPLNVGFVMSAIVGTFALKLVLVLLYRAKLKVFAIYLFLLAELVAMGSLRDSSRPNLVRARVTVGLTQPAHS